MPENVGKIEREFCHQKIVEFDEPVDRSISGLVAFYAEK